MAVSTERHPARIGRLVLISPTIDERWKKRVPPSWLRGARHERRADPVVGDHRGILKRMAQWVLAAPRRPIGVSRPSLRRLIFAEYVSAGPRRVLATYRCALSDRIEDRLPQIQVPVLVVRGGDDRLVSSGWASGLAGLAPAGSFAEARGVSHDGCYERPGSIAGLLLDHIAEPPEDASDSRS